MPNRILRENILSSERIEQLDAPAEVFYRRLMSKVDDHGLFDGRLAMLRSTLYPLRIDRVREADIARWIAACEKAGVIALYSIDGKPYGQMLDTKWQARSEPKFPAPPWGIGEHQKPDANSCAQVQTSAPVFGVGVVVENGDGVARKRATRTKAVKTPIPEGFTASERVVTWAREHGFDRIDEHLQAFARKCVAKAYTYADWDSAFMEAIREDWAKLRGRAPNGAAPPAESTVNPRIESTAALLAEQQQHASTPLSPEQRAAVAEKLAKARQLVTSAGHRIGTAA